MKSKTSLTTLLAAALLTGAQGVHAQNPPEEPQEKGERAIQRQVEQNQNRVQEVQEKVDKARRRAEVTVRANQDTLHMLQGEMPEPPPRIEAGGFDWAGDGRMFDGMKESFTMLGGAPRANSPVVLTTSALDAETLTGLREDLIVMSRILNKSIEHGRDNQERVMGITVNALASARRPQAMYLEGYGAVFLMNVPVALAPPPPKEEEKAAKTADTEWERTKRELYGTRPTLDKNIEFVAAPGKPVRYDPEKVDSLKRDLLEALKNAANLRQVKPNEHVSIMLTGGQGSTATVVARVNNKVSTRSKGEDAKADKEDRKEKDEAKPAPAAKVFTRATDKTATRETTLTIRVKKADIDAYAKGTLNFEDFAKKASVAAY